MQDVSRNRRRRDTAEVMALQAESRKLKAYWRVQGGGGREGGRESERASLKGASESVFPSCLRHCTKTSLSPR